MNKYIGNTAQLYGVQEYRLTGGKGDGMRMLRVKNGKGLDFEISLDRAGDISVLSADGVNMGYFSPCGYVSPQYYDSQGLGFLKSFTAGFFTTCGLTAVGSPCTDNGEELGLHGTISNTPCESFGYWCDDENIHIKLTVRDARMFSHQLILEREYVCPLNQNAIYMTDIIKNIGSAQAPLEVLYHCNMGYPLLSENAEVTIPAKSVKARNEHANKDIADCLKMEKPQNGYEEKCYYFETEGNVTATIYNKDINKGVSITYNADELQFFTEWKMMGEYEYVLGLEPGNCTPDGRDVMRKSGKLEFLNAGDTKVHHLKFEFFNK